MPIYEYRCKNCEQTLEALQSIKDVPLVHCAACGQDALERLISAAGFRLKGGGWYETDFKTEKQKNILKTTEESSSAAAVKTEATTPPTTASTPVKNEKPVSASGNTGSTTNT